MDSIERGHEADRAALELIKKHGAFLVPTIGYFEVGLEEAPSELSSPALQEGLGKAR